MEFLKNSAAVCFYDKITNGATYSKVPNNLVGGINKCAGSNPGSSSSVALIRAFTLCFLL